MEPYEQFEYQLGPEDIVVLSRRGLDDARHQLPELVSFLEGTAFWFPAFEVPNYEGQTGAEEVEPGHWQVTGFDGGKPESDLISFAHIVRPFEWVNDPRTEWLQMVVDGAKTVTGRQMLRDISAQDLWDATFVVARASRFGDGGLAGSPEGITAVANDIRRRLLASLSSPGIT